VLEFIGTVADLFPQIPVFSRHPFEVEAKRIGIKRA
jgi:hypothetical protein